MARHDARSIGALLAAVASALVVASTNLWHPFDIDAGWVADRPEAFVFVLALTAIVGWWAAGAATAGDYVQAGAVGAGGGVAWILLGVAVAVGAAFVDAFTRDAAGAFDIGPTVVWGLYGLAYLVVIGSVVTAPVGIAWGVTTRLVVGPAAVASPGSGPGEPDTNEPGQRPTRQPGRRALAALTVLALMGGLFQAAENAPPRDARCLDIGGERPLDAAFSSNGEWLAVVASNDLNAGGLVRLLRWPSGETVTTWRAWVDHDVAVAPDGRVYWSAWELESPWRGGIVTAVAGGEPAWLTTDGTSGLWSLTWTAGALRGMTANDHLVASLPLDGRSDPALSFELTTEPVGTFWASPDGRTTATSVEWFAESVTVTRPDGSVEHVQVVDDPRSIALTPDGKALVVAGWSGGTRLVEVEGQSSRRLLPRTQSWIAVSPQGDLAWSDEEQVGTGRLCVAPLLVEYRADGTAAR